MPFSVLGRRHRAHIGLPCKTFHGESTRGIAEIDVTVFGFAFLGTKVSATSRIFERWIVRSFVRWSIFSNRSKRIFGTWTPNGVKRESSKDRSIISLPCPVCREIAVPRIRFLARNGNLLGYYLADERKRERERSIRRRCPLSVVAKENPTPRPDNVNDGLKTSGTEEREIRFPCSARLVSFRDTSRFEGTADFPANAISFIVLRFVGDW